MLHDVVNCLGVARRRLIGQFFFQGLFLAVCLRRIVMRRVCVLLSLLFPALMFAQGSKSPVMDAVRQSLAGQQKDIEAAVDEMPADKYGSRPTPDQMTFGH